MKAHPIFLILPLSLLLTTPHAQQKRTRVGFVDVQKIVAALPGGASYLKLRTNADADLLKKQQNIQKLSVQANRTRKTSDIQALQKAQNDFVSAQKGYQSRLATAFKPVASKVDNTIAAVARSGGFSVVLDKAVAARSKLVVYANTATTDLTPNVLKALKK